jgi:hypothetical protein
MPEHDPYHAGTWYTMDEVFGEEDMTALELKELFALPADAARQAASAYLAARQRREKAELALKTASEQEVAAEQLLLGALDAAHLGGVALPSGDRMTSVTVSHYSLPGGGLDRQDIRLWLLRQGGHDIIRSVVDRHDLSKLCRGLVEKGRAIHPDVRVVTKRTIRLTKGQI